MTDQPLPPVYPPVPDTVAAYEAGALALFVTMVVDVSDGQISAEAARTMWAEAKADNPMKTEALDIARVIIDAARPHLTGA